MSLSPKTTINFVAKLCPFFASSLLSKAERRIWFPAVQTWKPFFERHNGLKVRMIASVLSARLVKNFSAKIVSPDDLSLDKKSFGNTETSLSL